jgi:DNA-binding response OmpR family regulator
MAHMAVEPLVLLANTDTWLTESLESVLTQAGYRVITTAKRQQVLELARRQLPDAILLDIGLDQRASDSFTLCRALRADGMISRATPIILMTAGPALRQQQIDALRAGAWELRGDPLDMEELVLRLGVYVQGKLELDHLTNEGLIDQISGLYNEAGVTRRARELAAFTAREGLPLACAVLQPSDGALTGGAADRLAIAVKHAGRVSDAIGRTGTVEFTVFAPATDETGAEGMVQRITDAVSSSVGVRLRSGISADVGRPRASRTSSAYTDPHRLAPPELLARARQGLR